MSPHVITWTVAALATAGVIVRPFNLPEAIWAVAGAVLLVALGLISIADALIGVAKGTDVYLFLFGMMLLTEIAREEGLFAWLAAVATSHAKGSARRLFLLTFGVGTIVTIFLSNDATAVVLTPAVAAAAHTAKTKQPLPYLLICAFIANAASFVLPISNPANLVIYGSHMPPLLQWLPAYRVALLSVDRRDLSAAAVDPARRARPGDRNGCADSDPFGCGQNRRDRHRGDGDRAPRYIGVGHCTRASHRDRRDRDCGDRTNSRAEETVECGEGYLLGCIAARRWAFCIGRSARQDRADPGDYGAPPRRSATLRDLGRLGRRHCRRCGQQPDQ